MKTKVMTRAALAAALACACAAPALAATHSVFFGTLNASATVSTPMGAGDTLLVDTLVTTEVGALLQEVTFTLDSTVSQFEGAAVWQVGGATSTLPRLVGVNIDILDSANNVVASDTFAGLLAGFAHSTFAGSLGPGTYTLVATGNGVRDSSLDISLAFAVPEPQSYLMMLGGLFAVGFIAHRRLRRGD